MLALPTESTLSSTYVVDLLSPHLGKEKSSEVVSAVVLKLALPDADLSPDQALTLLEELSRTAGMVGIAARFARSRLDAVRLPPPSSRRAGGSGGSQTLEPSPDKLGPATSIVTVADLAALLTSAVGTDQARDIVLDAARKLGLPSDRLEKAQAMALLDHLAVEPGMVGMCARFGKARLILRFAA
jgi:hypothetical protein